MQRELGLRPPGRLSIRVSMSERAFRCRHRIIRADVERGVLNGFLVVKVGAARADRCGAAPRRQNALQ